MFITGLHRGGGAEVQFVHLARHLARRGWRVDVVTLMPVNHFEQSLRDVGADVHTLGIARGRYDPRAPTRLVALLRRTSPTVLCTFLYHANVLGRLAGWLAGTPIVVSSIRNVDFGGRRADRWLRWSDRLCDLTTTNSRLAAEALAARRVTRAGCLRVVPNGIETGRLDAEAGDRAWLAREVGGAPDGFTWLAVGRLEPQKAYHVTLDALALVHAEGFPQARLAIAGEGGQRETLRLRAEGLGVAANVTFLGNRADVPRLLRSADAFVMSSLWEGLPNAVMEAMVARIPVVASAVGGVPELVHDGETGWLVPPGDARALADAMLRTMRMPTEARRTMLDRGRGHIEEQYALATVLGAWERVFEEVLAHRAAHGGAWFGLRRRCPGVAH